MSGIPKPTLKQRFSDFATFLYNSKEGTVLGRNGKSWGQIGLFYVIYYIFLSGFWITTIVVFYQTIDDKVPKLMGTDSLLKSNPGLGYRPVTVLESSLIRFSKSNEATYMPYVANIEKLMNKHGHLSPEELANQDGNCGLHKGLRTGKPTACQFNADEVFGNCSSVDSGDKYGYDTGKPCILLKLNKIFGWEPKALTDNSTIKNLIEKNGAVVTQNNGDSISVTCTGENMADRDNVNSITFYPKTGFNYKYFPFENQVGYRAPLLMAKFDVKPNVVIMVECKLWAEGIIHDKQTRKGLVHFELLMDE